MKSRALQLALGTALAASVVMPAPARAAATIQVPADVATIQEAIETASDGDTVVVAPGTYVEVIDFLGKDLVVMSSAGPAATTIERPGQLGGLIPTVQLISGEPATAELSGFTITDPGGSTARTISVEDSSVSITSSILVDTGLVIVEDGSVSITGSYFGRTVGDLPDVIINRSSAFVAGNEFAGAVLRVTNDIAGAETVHVRSNRAVGAQSSWEIKANAPLIEGNAFLDSHYRLRIEGKAPVVTNNVIIGDQSLAGDIRFKATGAGRFVHNTLVSRRDNLSEFTGPRSAVVANNIFVGVGRFGVIECSNNLTVRSNTFWSTKTKVLNGSCTSIGQDGNRREDPKLVNGAGFDAHLLAGSPAIDAAADRYSVETDAEGIARPIDGDGNGVARGDRGAYEYTGSSIRGRVTNGPNARPGICIEAHSPEAVFYSRTKTNGTYRVSVPPGTYKVKFEDCSHGVLQTQWYEGVATAAEATRVVVGSLQNVGGVDADLVPNVECDGVAATIVGTPGDDVLKGTPGPDVISGLDGADVLNGLGGDDIICSDAGYDVLRGGPGSDRLIGGSGYNRFVGSRGRDTLIGGDDTDVIDMRPAKHGITVNLKRGRMIGWGSADLSSIERVIGSKFNDTLVGDSGSNEIIGGFGDDVIRPGGGEDRVDAGRGNDTVISGSGSLTYDGGWGDDLIVVTAGAIVSANGGEGFDALTIGPSSAGVQVVDQHVDLEDREASIRNIELLGGTPYSDNFDVRQEMYVFAGDGNDIIKGGFRSYLDGGLGNDSLAGDAGAVLVGGMGDDTLRLLGPEGLAAPGPGTNIVEGSTFADDAVSFELEASPVTVNLRFGVATWEDGSATIRGVEYAVGSAWDDTLTGDANVNILVGLDGSDTIRGLGETDYLDGGAGTDALLGGEGTDYCFNGESHSSCEVIERTDLVGRQQAALALTGNPAINLIFTTALTLDPLNHTVPGRRSLT